VRKSANFASIAALMSGWNASCHIICARSSSRGPRFCCALILRSSLVDLDEVLHDVLRIVW